MRIIDLATLQAFILKDEAKYSNAFDLFADKRNFGQLVQVSLTPVKKV